SFARLEDVIAREDPRLVQSPRFCVQNNQGSRALRSTGYSLLRTLGIRPVSLRFVLASDFPLPVPSWRLSAISCRGYEQRPNVDEAEPPPAPSALARVLFAKPAPFTRSRSTITGRAGSVALSKG